MKTGIIGKALAAPCLLLALGGLACNRSPVGQPRPPATSTPNFQAQGAQPVPKNQSANAPVSPKAPEISKDLDKIAKQVAEDVGTVQTTHAQGETGPVFVFEEFHTSRVGQLQIAVMLLRLHEKHGLKRIGLEGTVQSRRPLDGTWFHNAGGKDARDARENVAVRILAEGEISSSEFMALLFPSIEVYGIEVAAEMNVKQPEGNPLAFYLVSIAEKLATPADLKKTLALLVEAKGLEKDGKKEEANKKTKEAFEHLLTAHPWLRDRYQRGNDAASLGTMKRHTEEIKAKAAELGLIIPARTQEEFKQYMGFLEARHKASDTMVSRATELARTASRQPVAFIIGAAHSERVMELLRESKISFALIRPHPINPEYGQMSIKQFERKHKQQWALNSEGTLGRLLNGRHKQPAVIETATAKSYANAKLAGMLIALTARAGGNVPDDVRGQLANLPELRINFNSFERDGSDVIFSMWVKNTEGTEKQVWARVGAVADQRQARSLEEKLKHQIVDLGGGDGSIPPRDPPNNSQAAKDEGPGDGKRNGVVISRTGPSTLAVFAESKAEVVQVGRISG
jgi:hypothetical protein